jgi:deoxyribonuclease-4
MMPLFGAHMSVAGGLHEALLAAQRYQCQTVQLFTKNANQWKAKDLSPDQLATFRRTLADTGIQFPTAHDSYLINLASPDEALYRKSLEAFVVELQRAEALGLSYLVTHPGAHVGEGEPAGLARVAGAIDEVHRRCAGFRVQILLENTAGQGSTLGFRFEHLAEIIGAVAEPDRLGVCFDTCHAFAAGYALGTMAEYQRTMGEFERAVGLKRLKAFHMNDSLKPFGSRVDRHAHIGEGEMGLEPFRWLVNDPRFRDRPMILETPKDAPGRPEMDGVNLATVRGLLAG